MTQCRPPDHQDYKAIANKFGQHRLAVRLLELGNEMRRASLQWGCPALRFTDLGNDR